MPLICMGLDYGSLTVGVAVSDALGITVQPVETIKRERESALRKTCARIEKIIKERNISLIVLGRPLHMNESEGERVYKTSEFKKMLEKRINIEIVWQDERLTTREADSVLDELGIKRSERKAYIDQIAACLILKDYLSSKT